MKFATAIVATALAVGVLAAPTPGKTVEDYFVGADKRDKTVEDYFIGAEKRDNTIKDYFIGAN
ncbi:hypothetical protein J3459_007586 [Metarhizium acridum]|uniref:uncharacterized protein n=1 Tax=Metarhizium acridum TaxID=92637 RepID=UPI001C6B304E|nr:hypothetical protein J3458_007068 [Metarhizium acridum]KAG8426991.1 hypothetical protein J3459_007615 [Metarhizium acridum]KAG8427039.1 hypothetical protein J3459_007586 [Metarhizium acridum]